MGQPLGLVYAALNEAIATSLDRVSKGACTTPSAGKSPQLMLAACNTREALPSVS